MHHLHPNPQPDYPDHPHPGVEHACAPLLGVGTVLSMAVMRNCPDCGVAPGQEHLSGEYEGDFGGCDVARCLVTGSQRLACQGFEQHAGSCGRDIWTGEWPGMLECREFGWYAKLGPQGWVQTTADDPDGHENLNRLFADAIWSPELRRFVLR